MQIRDVRIDNIRIGEGQPLALIAGPCVIESRDHTLRLADSMARICRKVDIPFIFKASYDKANRSSIDSFRGPGLDKGLAILHEVRQETGIPVLSDVHTPDQITPAAQVLDVLQIPAFLCRQTDLLLSAAQTNRCVNIKKGQFMSPEEMGNVAKKITTVGNQRVMLTERGTFFGYNRLVNDMTSLAIMKRFAPVVFDATHSCQLPGGQGNQSGGRREFVGPLALAGIAAGADALFLEVHDNPAAALSDAATVFPMDQLEALLQRCRKVAEIVRAA